MKQRRGAKMAIVGSHATE